MERSGSPHRVRSFVVLFVGIALVIGLSALVSQNLPNTVREEFLGATVTVPEEYSELILAASDRCPAIPAEIFAAQLHAESGWDPAAISSAGAQGIAQFMPSTWEQYGFDADGDGKADVLNPVDAVHSAAALNCINRKLVAEVSGKRLINTLAAYNAGFGSVRKYDGMPPFPETENYVEKILRNSQSLTWG